MSSDSDKKESVEEVESTTESASEESENSEISVKTDELEGIDEEKIDKSLDEVSNVIHDLLNEPNYEDTDEKVEQVMTESETKVEIIEEPTKEEPEPVAAEPEPEEKSESTKKFGKFTGFFKKKKESQEVEEPLVEETPEPVAEEPEIQLDVVPEEKIPDNVVESILEPVEVKAQYSSDKKYTFDEFIDERILISRDAFGKKEMKIKVLEVSDEKSPTAWKLGDRVKVNKILVTVKHLDSQEIEEGEFDIQSIEQELAKERHYSSTNRWVPTNDIKNGYVTGSRHTSLISDAIALEYIVF